MCRVRRGVQPAGGLQSLRFLARPQGEFHVQSQGSTYLRGRFDKAGAKQNAKNCSFLKLHALRPGDSVDKYMQK